MYEADVFFHSYVIVKKYQIVWRNWNDLTFHWSYCVWEERNNNYSARTLFLDEQTYFSVQHTYKCV